MRGATVVAVLLGSGCVSARYAYDYNMVEPAAASRAMVLEDDQARIEFIVRDTEIAFTLANKTKEAESIVWDDSSLVVDGEAKKIFHEGVKYTNRMEHQPPSVVPPGARVTDSATPSENATFAGSAGWIVVPIFATNVFTGSADQEQKQQQRIAGNVGKELAVFLAVDVGGARRNYQAKFRVVGVRKIQQ